MLFKNQTKLQYEYSLVIGTILAAVALGFMVPPVAILAWATAGLGVVAYMSVAYTHAGKTVEATVKAETETN